MNPAIEPEPYLIWKGVPSCTYVAESADEYLPAGRGTAGCGGYWAWRRCARRGCAWQRCVRVLSRGGGGGALRRPRRAAAWLWLLRLRWRKHARLKPLHFAEGTHRLAEPVSKTTEKTCGGEPSEMSP